MKSRSIADKLLLGHVIVFSDSRPVAFIGFQANTLVSRYIVHSYDRDRLVENHTFEDLGVKEPHNQRSEPLIHPQVDSRVL